MYIGMGTVVLILIIVVIVMLMRGRLRNSPPSDRLVCEASENRRRRPSDRGAPGRREPGPRRWSRTPSGRPHHDPSCASVRSKADGGAAMPPNRSMVG